MDGPLFWLKQAFLATRRTFDDELAVYDLTSAQLDVLSHLWIEDGLEQRVLQERFGIASPTITGIVDGLVARGLVERQLSLEDGRVKRLILTTEGHALSTELGAAVANFERRLLTGFSATESALLREWLQRMTANMGGDPHKR